MWSRGGRSRYSGPLPDLLPAPVLALTPLTCLTGKSVPNRPFRLASVAWAPGRPAQRLRLTGLYPASIHTPHPHSNTHGATAPSSLVALDLTCLWGKSFAAFAPRERRSQRVAAPGRRPAQARARGLDGHWPSRLCIEADHRALRRRRPSTSAAASTARPPGGSAATAVLGALPRHVRCRGAQAGRCWRLGRRPCLGACRARAVGRSRSLFLKCPLTCL